VAVGSEVRRRQFAGSAADSIPISGEMRSRPVAGCVAGTRPLVSCRDVKCQTTILPFGLSPTILHLLVDEDKLLLEVSGLAVPS